jgi:hypothetical protein
MKNSAKSDIMAQLKRAWHRRHGTVAFGGARLLTSRTIHVGGASVLASRRAKLFSAPNQIEHSTLERPVLNAFDQSFANGIFPHINPFLRVILIIAQPMMPAARLKFPFWLGERPREPFLFQREFAFPIGNPCFNREMQISWRAKQMQMVRHQQIIANEPSRCLRPNLVKKLMCSFIRQPRFTLFGIDG